MGEPSNGRDTVTDVAMTALSADRPCTDPKDDLFGHAPFARHLAKSIRCHRGGDGFVIALHGPWGSGKTTILNYVCHYLEADKPADADAPVVVHFNLWWFSGREDLAHAFLRQLQTALPAKNAKLKRVGDLLGKYGEDIGGAVDLSGVTGGLGRMAGRVLGQIFNKTPRDVPALKARIADELRKAKVRILVIIDDIDRLDHDEVRQLFTVVKALADFPFVTYLLAFDREAAVQAIEQDSGLPGARYLEKIIQVPFEIPLIDRITLRNVVLRRLNDEVLSYKREPLFDTGHNIRVFYGCLERLICVPRDAVRFLNTLSVTFPAVAGDVNPIDFIAIEMIRVFLPRLYDTIRFNKEKFTGPRASSTAMSVKDEFHEQWARELPESLRNGMREMVGRLFPKTAASDDWNRPEMEWHRDLRICHPDLFYIYFRLSLMPGIVSHREVMALIAAIPTPENFKDILLRAKTETALGGISKSRALIERLTEHVDTKVAVADIPRLIVQLLDIGDELIGPQPVHRFSYQPDDALMGDLACRLLRRLEREKRADVITQGIRTGGALRIQDWVLSIGEHELTKGTPSGDATLIGADDLEQLKRLWMERVRTLSAQPAFLTRPKLSGILESWRQWGDAAALRCWCEDVAATDEGLLELLQQFLQDTRQHTLGEPVIRQVPRLNPTWLEPYLDTRLCFDRLLQLRDRGAIPSEFQAAVDQFIREYELLAQGKDPDVP